MDDRDVGRLWNENAEVWTRLARSGYDVYRDRLNTPAFLAMLPDVDGLRGLDVGCGEGHNTRLIAKRGARLAAVDIAEAFIGHAREEEERAPLGIDYRVASALELPFADGSFDFVTAVMCLMDMPDVERAVAEAYRVLKPGGFFQFSIMHPCYDTPHRKNLRDAQRRTYAYEVGGYFETLEGKVEEWTFSAAPEDVRKSVAKFKVPRFTRTLGRWLKSAVSRPSSRSTSGRRRRDRAAATSRPARSMDRGQAPTTSTWTAGSPTSCRFPSSRTTRAFPGTTSR